MRKVSKKRAQQNKEYKIVRDQYIEEHLFCQVKYCGICTGRATEIHHTNGRNGDRLLDTHYFLAVCRACHNYIHNNPKESRERGWLL